MKKSRFSDQQIAFALQQAETGTSVPDVCRKLGISEATFYRWKERYGGLMPSEVRKLKHLEEENGRLRRLVSDLSLDKEMLQEVLRKKSLRPAQRRELVDHIRTCFRVGTRRACRVLILHRSMYLYRSRRPEQAVLRKRIRAIAEMRVRYGYRRIHILLQREGWSVGRTRVYRLYRLEGLQMRHKPPRRRVMAKLRDDRTTAIAPNDCWSIDWMYDQLFDGSRLWVLTLVDNFSRLCPALWVGHQAKTSDVVSTLNHAVAAFGKPQSIRVDNGSQFTSREFDLWAYANNVILDFSRPGKPTDNAFIESFNARVRLECLNQHWFLDLDDARTKIELWRQDYNDVRPHSAIGERTPMIMFTAHRNTPMGSTVPESLI